MNGIWSKFCFKGSMKKEYLTQMSKAENIFIVRCHFPYIQAIKDEQFYIIRFLESIRAIFGLKRNKPLKKRVFFYALMTNDDHD